MLKRLELFGFKSFADKTAFDFGNGITAVVGPNGSGKSNVVDSIKWVLGEQSAKSLRGKEMADVIFNGSGTRRSLGFAEATLVFDNSDRILPLDTHEVRLTRRVYRSGDSEYLINKSPARLKDFKELFMGTGAGTQAYSIIEQGKVDVLLQSSTKDRRILFEEAAGISRFLARKVEALRKLERVEQNLLRVTDIVEEVQKQFRSVKLQAAKARRYQEHSERLKEIRIAVGMADYHIQTSQLNLLDSNSEQFKNSLEEDTARCEALSAKLMQIESLASDMDGTIRILESQLTEVRQELARHESEISYERAHSHDLAAQIQKLRSQSSEFAQKVLDLTRQVEMIRAEVARVDEEYTAGREAVAGEEARIERLKVDSDDARIEIESLQSQHLEHTQDSHRIRNDLATLEAQVKALTTQRHRLDNRCSQLRDPITTLESSIAAFSLQERDVEQQLSGARNELGQLNDQIEQVRAQHEEVQHDLAGLREQRSSSQARVELLEDLERRHEGVGKGVQEALEHPQFSSQIVGLVADLLEVDIEQATFIERALGIRAQLVIVRSQSETLVLLNGLEQRWQNPVSFLALDCISNPSSLQDPPSGARLALNFVKAAPELEQVAVHLLGRTWVVSDLSQAIAYAATHPDIRFVTEQGDVLESDGTVTAGETESAVGLVSRKSQLRALHEELISIDSRVAELETSQAELKQQLDRLEHEADQMSEKSADYAEKLSGVQKELARDRHQFDSLSEELGAHRAEIVTIDEDLDDLTERQSELTEDLTETENQATGLEFVIAEKDRKAKDRTRLIEDRQYALNAAQVTLAKTEGQLTGLRQRLTSVETDLEERQRLRTSIADQIGMSIQEEQVCNRKILNATSLVAEMYVRKEELSHAVDVQLKKRDEYRDQRVELNTSTQKARQALQELQDQAHKSDLEANHLRHELSTMMERILEDYDIDMAELHKSYDPDQQQEFKRDDVEAEMQQLRKKLNSLGNVNMEALEELQELETRSVTLQSQLEDLQKSKLNLDEIITKINEDSERLFSETLETIRQHFGDLFRKLFGGGKADIVLENPENVLESGIEIVARPPGKELRSISLLSGGEKTMTAVALLLAVFRSKPSPFCILDEVDAALDDANIERFTSAIPEFLDKSQFIIITHSKITMCCADVLYGVTMQESGISKRVSVVLEDVNESGEISDEAVARTDASRETNSQLDAIPPAKAEDAA